MIHVYILLGHVLFIVPQDLYFVNRKGYGRNGRGPFQVATVSVGNHVNPYECEV